MPGALTPPRLVSRIPPPPRADDGGPRDDGDGLSPGHVLEGRYEIEDRIGEGGIGVVYRARQLKLHRRVAVKLLLRDQIGDHLLRPRFEREAVTLAALSHPNIVGLTDYGMIRGRPFIVMELLEGRTLRTLLDEEGALEPQRALSLCRQILYALAYAHPLGVVHRDLKPANIVVQSPPDQPEHVKLLDFGLVKLLPGSQLDSGPKLSRAGFAFGTPAYMSPEHATGGEVDERSDLYAVGILLFEMLTGQKPFDGELEQVLRSHLGAPVPKIAERRPELSARQDLQVIIDKSMAKVRADRFRTASEMLAAIDALRSDSLAPKLAARAEGQSDPFEDLWNRLESKLGPRAQRARELYEQRAQPHIEHAYALTQARARALYFSLRTRSRAFWAEAKPKLLELYELSVSRVKDLSQRTQGRLGERGARVVPSLPAPPTEHTAPLPAVEGEKASAPVPESAQKQAQDASIIPLTMSSMELVEESKISATDQASIEVLAAHAPANEREPTLH